MQFLLDNIIAVIVAVSLTVLLLTQQTATRQDALERESVYNAKTQALSLSSWLERDIVKLGARFGADRDRFRYTEPVVRNGVPLTPSFTFFFNEGENPDGTVDRVKVEYLIVRTDSAKVAVAPDRYAPLYQLQRSEGAGRYKDGKWRDAANNPTTVEPTLIRSRTHGSPPGLTSFYIEPRTSDGAAILDPTRATDADYMRVQFSILPTLFPVYRARYVNASGLSWASTFEIRPF